jgi:hypothetical protein
MVLRRQRAPDVGWNPTWRIAGREGAPRRFVYSIQHFLNRLGNLQIFFRQQLWRARWALWIYDCWDDHSSLRLGFGLAHDALPNDDIIIR